MQAQRQRRSEELGRVLRRARKIQSRTIVDCARHMGMTRQRYADLETGAAHITAAELEQLVRYLRIPPYVAYPAGYEDVGAAPREKLVYVRAEEGEAVHIVVGPYDPADVPEAYGYSIATE